MDSSEPSVIGSKLCPILKISWLNVHLSPRVLHENRLQHAVFPSKNSIHKLILNQYSRIIEVFHIKGFAVRCETTLQPKWKYLRCRSKVGFSHMHSGQRIGGCLAGWRETHVVRYQPKSRQFDFKPHFKPRRMDSPRPFPNWRHLYWYGLLFIVFYLKASTENPNLIASVP